MTDSYEALEGLEPAALWARFEEILRIPRPSGHEEAIRRHVLDFAARHDCETAVDEAGNLVIRVPASEGYEEAPTVVLQGHLDMVCEKDSGTDFNFFKDSIRVDLDGDYLRARGTTLGADNGIGLAAGLGLITESPRPHGPLELLFTVDEETGLNGVRDLDPSLVTGRLLLNLDSEEEGVLTIACVGARSVGFSMPISWQAPPRAGDAFLVRLAGATGGHSGGDIHRGRVNVLRALAEVLDEVPDLALASFSGGSVRNAIPRHAEAVVVAPPKALLRATGAARERLAREFGETDPQLRLSVEPRGQRPARVLCADTASNLLGLLHQVPYGVLAMSEELPGMVQTSCNLATVRTYEKEVEILCSVRGAIVEELASAVAEIADLGRSLGADAETPEGYPGWRPNPESPLLREAQEVYRRMVGEEPQITGVHGGLECGVLGALIEGLDMISFGPDIDNPHSPSEQISVSSVKRVFGEYLPALLEALAGQPRRDS